MFETDLRSDVRLRVVPVEGAKLREDAQGPPIRQGEQPGKEKAGRTNASEPPVMPRYRQSRETG